MKQFDSWLIDKHEQFAHWFQRWTGLTNFWLVRLLWPMNIVAFLVFAMMLQYSPLPVGVFPILLLAGLMIGICFPKILETTRALESHYEGANTSAHSLTLMYREFWFMRTIVVAWHILTLSAVGVGSAVLMYGSPWLYSLLALFLLASATAYYFLACVPLPPARQLVEVPTPTA